MPTSSKTTIHMIRDSALVGGDANWQPFEDRPCLIQWIPDESNDRAVIHIAKNNNPPAIYPDNRIVAWLPHHKAPYIVVMSSARHAPATQLRRLVDIERMGLSGTTSPPDPLDALIEQGIRNIKLFDPATVSSEHASPNHFKISVPLWPLFQWTCSHYGPPPQTPSVWAAITVRRMLTGCLRSFPQAWAAQLWVRLRCTTSKDSISDDPHR